MIKKKKNFAALKDIFHLPESDPVVETPKNALKIRLIQIDKKTPIDTDNIIF